MSDAIWVAIIGVAGTVIGSVATVLVARIQASRKEGWGVTSDAKQTTLVLGELVDIRELRILRALFGEPQGRFLAAYNTKWYGLTLKAVVNKGWAKQIEGKYYMTTKGAEFAQEYLKQLFGTWQPANQILG